MSLFPADRSKNWGLLESPKDVNRGLDKEGNPHTGLNEPKHGKEDPKNEIHVGGNSWAGGTGGSDTAGLGGLRTSLQSAGKVGKKTGLKRHAQPTRRAARRCAKVGSSKIHDDRP